MTKEEIREVLDKANPNEILQFIEKINFYVQQMETLTKAYEIIAAQLSKLDAQRDRRDRALNVIASLSEQLEFPEEQPIQVDATVKQG